MIFIYFLAVFGLTFTIKEVNGPFGLFAKFRNWLMRSPSLGVFFYKLLDCYFCTGFHSSWIVYLLFNPITNWAFPELLIFAFAGAAFCYIVSIILNKLNVTTFETQNTVYDEGKNG